MKLILKAKHYQVFIILLIGLLFNITTIENEPLYTALLDVIGLWIYMTYPFLIGYTLHSYIAPRIKLNHNLFQINYLIVVTTYSVTAILSEGQGMNFSGVAAIPFFYIFYAFIHCLAFPVKSIKTIELGRKVTLGDYIGDFFLILLAPIGVWFLQPRMNRILNSENINDEPPTSRT